MQEYILCINNEEVYVKKKLPIKKTNPCVWGDGKLWEIAAEIKDTLERHGAICEDIDYSWDKYIPDDSKVLAILKKNCLIDKECKIPKIIEFKIRLKY
jgi:hypothetical protein